MRRKLQILVIGYNGDSCTKEAYDIAYQVGKEVAKKGAVLLTGGLGGVMEAACKGASESKGIAIGVIPFEDFADANQYCNIVICTGIGFARDFITAYSTDGVVIVGGGIGTLIEAGAAYMKKKPIVAILGSGGTADEYAGKYLDERKRVKILSAKTATEAMHIILKSVAT
ncbi:MAG: TIGR00725 family protein [Nitrososphaerales archaeon]